MIWVPPGGFAGFAQQATAVRQKVAQAVRGGAARSGKSRRKSKKKAARAAPRARRKSKSKRPARLVKGSAAAKRYMASIRKKRK